MREYIEATNTHDFDNVEALVHADAVYFFSDQTCRAGLELRNYFERTWRTVVDEAYAAENLHWISIDEQSATCVYQYTWAGLIDGVMRQGVGRGTNVLIREQGQWLVVHEHLSGGQWGG